MRIEVKGGEKDEDALTRGTEGASMLHIAAFPKLYCPPFHWAKLNYRTGHSNVCQMLVRSGVDVNAEDVDTNTPLHKAYLCLRKLRGARKFLEAKQVSFPSVRCRAQELGCGRDGESHGNGFHDPHFACGVGMEKSSGAGRLDGLGGLGGRSGHADHVGPCEGERPSEEDMEDPSGMEAARPLCEWVDSLVSYAAGTTEIVVTKATWAQELLLHIEKYLKNQNGQALCGAAGASRKRHLKKEQKRKHLYNAFCDEMHAMLEREIAELAVDEDTQQQVIDTLIDLGAEVTKVNLAGQSPFHESDQYEYYNSKVPGMQEALYDQEAKPEQQDIFRDKSLQQSIMTVWSNQMFNSKVRDLVLWLALIATYAVVVMLQMGLFLDSVQDSRAFQHSAAEEVWTDEWQDAPALTFGDVATEEEFWGFAVEMLPPAMRTRTSTYRDAAGPHSYSWTPIVGALRLRQQRAYRVDCRTRVPVVTALPPGAGVAAGEGVCFEEGYGQLASSAPVGYGGAVIGGGSGVGIGGPGIGDQQRLENFTVGGQTSRWLGEEERKYLPERFGPMMKRWYGNGGYALDIPTGNEAAVKEALVALRDNGWIDAATRVVFIEYNRHDPSLGIYLCVALMVEFEATGLVGTHAHTRRVLPPTYFEGILYRPHGWEPALFCEIVLCVMMAYYLYKEVVQLVHTLPGPVIDSTSMDSAKKKKIKERVVYFPIPWPQSGDYIAVVDPKASDEGSEGGDEGGHGGEGGHDGHAYRRVFIQQSLLEEELEHYRDMRDKRLHRLDVQHFVKGSEVNAPRNVKQAKRWTYRLSCCCMRPHDSIQPDEYRHLTLAFKGLMNEGEEDEVRKRVERGGGKEKKGKEEKEYEEVREEGKDRTLSVSTNSNYDVIGGGGGDGGRTLSRGGGNGGSQDWGKTVSTSSYVSSVVSAGHGDAARAFSRRRMLFKQRRGGSCVSAKWNSRKRMPMSCSRARCWNCVRARCSGQKGLRYENLSNDGTDRHALTRQQVEDIYGGWYMGLSKWNVFPIPFYFTDVYNYLDLFLFTMFFVVVYRHIISVDLAKEMHANRTSFRPDAFPGDLVKLAESEYVK